MAPLLAERMGVPCSVHNAAPVGNALGAAVARPTLELSLYADTQQRRFLIDEDGIEGKIENPSAFRMAEAEKLVLEKLAFLAESRGAAHYAKEGRIELAEQFNMIRGWEGIGRIYQVRAQIAPGLIDDFKGVHN